MAEALVTSLLETLKTKGQEWLMTKAEEWLSSRENLQSLSNAFTTIQAVLYDAERRKGKEKALSIWLERLKDVAHDLGDLLEECNVEELKAQIEGSSRYAVPSSTILGHANKFVKLGTDIEFGKRMGRRINDIKQKLDNICKERVYFHLKEHDVNRDWKMDTSRTSSMIDESGVFGRKPDKDRVVKTLLGGMNEVRPVISIFGMDGLGKTTLAQLVYNDDRVIQHFEKRMWVHVSSSFDVKRICNAISESATGKVVPNFVEWNSVQTYLSYVLRGKRFLLVLDDVWNQDREEWEKLRLPLESGAPDSRIIITTCDNRVEKAMGASCIHHLHPLPEEDCQSMFKHLAFKGWREELSDFEDIGRQIVKKCEGVPLIVKRFANGLSLRRTIEEWRSLLNSETWDQPCVERGIKIDFLACYDNMPSYLKQCFGFCSIFPKDHTLEKDTLIQLWMSQGFILPKENEKIGIIGERYFQTLLSLSLFEDLATDQKGRMKHCKMKDIVHDMLHTIIGEYHIINKEMQIKKDTLVNARNVTLICSEDVESIPSSLCELEKLRTLMIIGWSRIAEVSINLFYKWKCLRSLDMSGASKVRTLPNSLGNLKLLKYLDLSTTEIEELPESVSGLLLLQTLKLNECRRLRKLPKEISKLLRLRHLEIKGTSSLEYLPKGIGKLTSLVTLSKFIANDDENGSSIEELGSFDHLEGELDVVNLECIPNENSGWMARMKDKRIDKLGLYYTARNDNEWSQIGDDEMDRVRTILGSLMPPSNLKELTICNYIGHAMPEWLSSVRDITCLRLADCRLCDTLSPCIYGSFWPNLKHLELDGMLCISDIKIHRYPNLETLIFKRMHGWEAWQWITLPCYCAMRDLIQLTISECPNLSALPSELGQSRKLQSICIEGCTKLMRLPSELRQVTNLQDLRIAGCPLLKERCREGGADWNNIAHVRNITIDEEQVK